MLKSPEIYPVEHTFSDGMGSGDRCSKVRTTTFNDIIPRS
jgi:hypothetical protein